MKTIANESIRPFDVDGTLILPYDENHPEDSIEIWDPIEQKYLTFTIHRAMVRLLKEEFSRNSIVIVWSRGGYEWAESVVKALGLERFVNYVMTKPMAYFDDLDVSEWLKDRIYIKPGVEYKK